jgi:hypothetical protein
VLPLIYPVLPLIYPAGEVAAARLPPGERLRD